MLDCTTSKKLPDCITGLAKAPYFIQCSPYSKKGTSYRLHITLIHSIGCIIINEAIMSIFLVER